MKQDKAIKKVLEGSNARLSFDFETRTIQRIQKMVERRKRKTFVLQLFLVSVVSVTLIFVVFYILNTKLETELTFGSILLVVNKVCSYSFELYIAFLALLLLSVDTILRKIHEVKNDNSM